MSIVEFLSQPLWQRLGLTLVHFLWQGLAVAVLVGAFVRVFRLNHGNARYAAYLLAFVAMIACPVVTFTAIDIPISPNAELVTVAESTEVVDMVSYTALPAGDILPEAETSMPSISSPAAMTNSIPLSQRISDWLHISIPWILVIWMVGVIVLSVRLVMGFIGVYRWRHHLEPLPERLAQRIASLSEGLGMRGFSRVFISPTVLQAMAVGYLRSMVLLPAAMVTRMQPEMLEAVIAHELAHIRRFDLWVNLAQRVVETLLFYHPAVWWLSICLRSERELCCDELAVKATGQRLTYATTLESVGRARFMAKQPILATGLGEGNKPTLSRVRHILGLDNKRKDSRFWLAGVIAVLLIMAIIIPTGFGLIGRLEDKPAVQVEGREVGAMSVIHAVDNKATLGSGLTVELLGMTEIPIKDNPWWKPNGSLIEQPPFDNVSNDPSRDPNHDQFTYYAIAMKLNGKTPDKIGLIKWDFTDALYADTTSAYLGDKGVYQKNIHAAAAKFPKDVENTTLRLGITGGDWETLVAGRHYGFYRKGEDTIVVRTPERAGGPFGVRPQEKGLHISVTYNITDRDFRVVAVDKYGKVHFSSRGGSSGTDNLRRTTASFSDLTRDKLQEYRFQTRRYEWVEFKDISLRPGKEAIALAERRRAVGREELEKWLGQGQTRRIREQILVLRGCRIFQEMETWASAIRELVSIGKPAVPELLAELRRAQRWPARSTIAFTLRAIGDRRAVAVLIEVLGRAEYRGEYGIHLKDPPLSVFMLENQHRPNPYWDGKQKDPQITIGCPIIEITAALEKITGHSEGHEHYGHKAVAELGSDAPREVVNRRIQEIVREVASRWQKWWDHHKTAVQVEGGKESTIGWVVDGRGHGIARVVMEFSQWDAKEKKRRNRQTIQTRKDGSFVIPFIELGEHGSFTNITAPGFDTRMSVGFTRRKDGTFYPDDRRIKLYRLGSIAGRVYDTDGNPLAGAPLSLATNVQYPNHSSSTANHFRAITDENGRFVMMNVPPGVHLLYYPWSGPSRAEVEKGIWDAYIKTGERYPSAPIKGVLSAQVIEVREGEKIGEVVVDLSQSTCSVIGQVRDTTGQPVAGAKVSLYWKFSGGTSSINGRGYPPVATDAEGRYRLQNLPPGDWHIKAWHDQVKQQSKPVPVELKPGRTIQQDLALSGQPELDAPRTDVQVEREGSESFRRKGWKIFGHHNGSKDYKDYVDSCVTSREEMNPEKLITVRCVDNEGKGISYCRITFVDRGEQIRFIDNVATDKDGYAYCDDIDGPFSIMAQVFDYSPLTKAWRFQHKKIEKLYTSKNHPVITVQWPPFPEGIGQVQGNVKDQYGRPLKEFDLVLTQREGQNEGWGDCLTKQIEKHFIHTEGNFEIGNLTAGTYTYFVYPKEQSAYVWDFNMGQVTVGAEDTVQLNIEIEAKNPAVQVVVEGIIANRDKFKCGYLAWSSKQITARFANSGRPATDLAGQYELWWDGKKMATKYVHDQVHVGPEGNRWVEKQQGGNSYDGGVLSRKPDFRSGNWLGPRITRWRGQGSQDWLIRQDSKQKNISKDWSVVDNNGVKLIRAITRNMNKTARDYRAYSIRDYDPSKGYGLVNEEWYNPDGSPRVKHTVKLQEVIPGGWFPVEVDFKSFTITDGRVYNHQHYALDIERCSFNDKSALPDRVFKRAVDKQLKYQEKLQKYLAMELEGLSDVKEIDKADKVKRGAREAIEIFIAAALEGDIEKAGEYAHPDRLPANQIADIPEIAKGQDLWIMAVVADDFSAIAVSSVIRGDHDRIGPLVFFLDRVSQDGRDNWWVHDIDMETPDGAEVELKQFLEKHPRAQKVPYENKPAVPVKISKVQKSSPLTAEDKTQVGETRSGETRGVRINT